LILTLILVLFAAWKVLALLFLPRRKILLYKNRGNIWTGKGRSYFKKDHFSIHWFDWVAGAMKFNSVKAGKYEIKKKHEFV
jgi:hypothetical protein